MTSPSGGTDATREALEPVADGPVPPRDRRLHQQALIVEASERLAKTRSIDEVVAVLRETARAAVGAEGIAVVCKDGDRCSYVAEDAVAPLWQGQSFADDGCVSGWVMRHGRTVTIPDVRLDPRVPQQAYAATFVRSLVMAPIGRPEPVAALGAYWSHVATHDAETVARIESLARLATIAIENARLAQARDRAAAFGAAQGRILELAVEDAPLSATLDAIVHEVEALSPAGAIGSILLLDADGTRLRHGAGPSLPATFNAGVDGIAVDSDCGPCARAIARDTPVFVPDIAADAQWPGFRDLALRHGLRACWSLPIRSTQGTLLGTFAMYHREPRAPAPADLDIVDFVVRTAGIVVTRARTEASMRASEARYRQIVESADDFAIVSLDAAGIITGWNRGAERVVGYAATEACGQPVGLYFVPEDRAAGAPEREMARARSEGRAVNERWHVRKDGTRFWGSGVTMPLAASEGGYLTIFRDRTGEHEAEAALRESEDRLRFFAQMDEQLFGAADAIDAMAVAAGLLGRKLRTSRCAYADVAADGDRFWIRSDYCAPGVASSTGSYSLDLFGPRAASDMRAGRTLVVDEVAREVPAEGGRDAFRSIGVEAIVCCPLIKDGRLAAMMAVHQDRARRWSASDVALVREVVERCWAHVERVGAEARLRESEERLRLAVDNADVGFWDVDVVTDTLIWPPRTKAMFGISADVAVTMQDFFDGLHPADRDVTIAAYLAAADGDVRALYDVEYRTLGREDGVERWVAAKGRGVFDAAGRCLRVAGTAVEITARRRAEEALREFNTTLEARVAEAVGERERAQEALRQSQKMEAMGQLTGGVAHDFNNLLTPIVGSLDLLQRKGVGGEREQRLIAGAIQSADRARTLVQRLLAFARRQPLQSVAVDIARLVQGMGELIGSTTGPQIRVVVDVGDDLPAAMADPNQLEMALLNLAVNARDAMPDGGTLRISARAETTPAHHHTRLVPGTYVRLSVADTGTGMDDAVRARAIEPFFSTKGIGKGTGLGLSMVHGLASQLGGALAIESREGVGTDVELWLPISAEPAEAAPRPAQATGTAAHRGIALLVDDEELVRMSTADMLADLGYAVIEAGSAEEAVRLLAGDRMPDIVVTDHLMPGMTGAELARHIGALRPGLPVLLVSGYADVGGVDTALPRLAKPFRKDELAAALATITGAGEGAIAA
ncbi:PAS domain S-box protein [Sphingomonas sp. A2-49]|uniref:GAF domain-containing protein n=1 Tax=Sphingomonas sp. A2-49 TaxID=1391375 RepID=UPI0021D122D3|nr:GAF domain-containing protein [Sphingomonas sp. A2-49]MCU6454150.1 PAS domain S-box protein [Sphingomonas sp. A2-49]